MPLEFEDNEEKLKEFIEIFNFKEIAERMEEKSFIDILSSFSLQLFKNLNSIDKIKYYFENLPDFYSLLFNQISKQILRDKEYNKFYEILSAAIKKNSKFSLDIISDYFKKQDIRLSTDEIQLSTLIYRKIGPDIFNAALNVSIKNLEKKISDIFTEFLLENQEQQFKIYFLDWILKLGYIIEGKIKDILLLKVRLKCILEGYNYLKIYKTRRLYLMGNLLNYLNEKKILARYRNAIFHTSFIIDYDIDYKKRKILFWELDGNAISFDIGEIVSLFFELIEKIQNYEIILFSTIINQKSIKELLKNSIQSEMNDQDIEKIANQIRNIEINENELKSYLKKEFKKLKLNF